MPSVSDRRRRAANALLVALALGGWAATGVGAHPGPQESLAALAAAPPDDARARLHAAVLHLELGELAAARRALATAAERLPPDDPGLARVAGRVARAGGEVEAALAHWRRGAVDASPLQASLHAEVAALASELGRWRAARRAWRAAVATAARPGPELYLGWTTAILEGATAATADPARLRAALTVLAAARRTLGEVPAVVAAEGEIAAALGRRPAPPPAPDTPTRTVATAAATTAATTAATATATLVRGPYLQRVTADAAIVRWRTDVATVGRAWWGASGEADGSGLAASVAEPAPGLEHEATLTGLEPGATVYYAVGIDDGDGSFTGSTVLAGPGPQHRLRTAPPAGTATSRLWVIGDSGTADDAARAVRDAYLAFPGSDATDLVLMLGDNAYGTGTEAEYQAAVFDIYGALLSRSPVWPAIGNHDALSADSPTQSGPFFDLFTLPTLGEAGGPPSGTEAYYAFDWGDLHLICLDTSDSALDPGSPMLLWLAADLAASDARWTVVFFHHPPYSKGSHDSDDPSDSGGRLVAVRENVVPLLEAAGVDLVLAGHSHAYERSALLHGHHGTSDTLLPEMLVDSGDGDPAGDGAYVVAASGPGTVYNVTGSSARVGPGSLDHPVMVRGLGELGSLVLDVSAGRLEGRFLDSAGTVGDRFLLLAHDHVFADGFESGDTTAWSPP